MLEKLTIVNEACALANATPIQSLEAQTPAAAMVRLAYDRVLGYCFGIHRFSFSLSTRRLSRLAEAPETGWLYAFDLPADRVGPPVRLTDAPKEPRRHFTDFLIEGPQVHADAPDLWAQIRITPAPMLWSPPFRHAFTTALAADLALTVKRDKTLRQIMWSEAFGDARAGGRGGLLLAAISDDGQSTPSLDNPAVTHDPLTSAWRS